MCSFDTDSQNSTCTDPVIRSVRAALTIALLASIVACSGSGGQGPAKGVAEAPESPGQSPVVPGPDGSDDGLAQDDSNDASASQIPNDQGPGDAPDSVTAVDRINLVVASNQRCAVVNEPLQVTVSQKNTQNEDNPDQFPNVTGYVQFTQSLGRSLRLDSRTDESATFAMNTADIVGLTASLEEGSITVYLASHFASAPNPFIIRKRVSGGCLYAFRSNDYCATGLAKSGTIAFARNGYTVSATGCDLFNPDNVPVIELNTPAR